MTFSTTRPALASMAAFTLSLTMAQAQVQDLGAPPGGRLIMQGLNADGSTVFGFAEDPVNGRKAAVWTEADGLRLLGVGMPGDFVGFGTSADGSVAFGARTDAAPSGFGYVGALWDTGTGVRTDIPPLPGETQSYVVRISADGSTAVGVSGDTASRPIRWTAATGTQEIPLPPNTHARVFGVSRDGTVIIGDYDLPTGGSLGWIWTSAGGTQTTIPGLTNWSTRDLSADGQVIVGVTGDPGFTSNRFYYRVGSAPVDINVGTTLPSGPSLILSADGSTVAGTANFSSGTTGFIWRPGQGHVLIGPGLGTNPWNISADGSVLAGATSTFGGAQESRAFRWDSSGLTFLESLDSGAPAGGIRLSLDGTTICGSSLTAAGDYHGALWRESGILGAVVCDPGSPNSSGVSSELILNGTNVITRGDLTLNVVGLPPNALTLFLVSRAVSTPTPIAGSQGQLCLGGSIARLLGPGQLQTAGPGGAASLTLDVSTLPAPVGGIMPGESLYFQAWHPDTNPTATSNLTSAATVRVF